MDISTWLNTRPEWVQIILFFIILLIILCNCKLISIICNLCTRRNTQINNQINTFNV